MSTANIISISGGKDSTALALLAIERNTENMEFVFADTGHEHLLTLKYLDYLESVIGPITRVKADFSKQMKTRRDNLQKLWEKEGISQSKIDRVKELCRPTGIPFLDLCLLKGRFPSTRARFCSAELKHAPIDDHVITPALAVYDEVISWQGVRAEESPSRARLSEREYVDNVCGLTNYRPILKWTVSQVFAMHKKHSVDPNPLYSMGMGRVGCMPCIHARKAEINEIANRFPEEIERVAEWEMLVSEASKRNISTFFAADKTPLLTNEQDPDRRSRIENIIEWAKTSRGGRQFDLLSDSEELPLCSSIYGLCE